MLPGRRRRGDGVGSEILASARRRAARPRESAKVHGARQRLAEDVGRWPRRTAYRADAALTLLWVLVTILHPRWVAKEMNRPRSLTSILSSSGSVIAAATISPLSAYSLVRAPSSPSPSVTPSDGRLLGRRPPPLAGDGPVACVGSRFVSASGVSDFSHGVPSDFALWL